MSENVSSGLLPGLRSLVIFYFIKFFYYYWSIILPFLTPSNSSASWRRGCPHTSHQRPVWLGSLLLEEKGWG